MTEEQENELLKANRYYKVYYKESKELFGSVLAESREQAQQNMDHILPDFFEVEV